MSGNRDAKLSRKQLQELPETQSWPDKAKIVSSSAIGTWEGSGYDGIDMSASLNRYFQGPYSFKEIVAWYQRQLGELGWPAGITVKSADGTPWLRWEWDLESIDLIDRVAGPDSAWATIAPELRGPRLQSELPDGWWSWSVTYKRKPPPGAKRPAALTPPTEEERFEKMFGLVTAYTKREGHADVPAGHREDDIGLGTWVANMRYMKACGDSDLYQTEPLRPEWVARLGGLPGWRWLSGDDFCLLERFANREGHTRIPKDHVEEGRPLGNVVAGWREAHQKARRAKLPSAWEQRLESIPGWEW